MHSYIFITNEGHTFQPGSETIEPDIENCQVVGFAKGVNAQQAFQNLIKENSFLLETTFDEIVCLELRNLDYHKQKTYFHLNNYKTESNACHT